MKKYDVVVIGGGPAGLAAAISAYKDNASVCLIEREDKLGGILKQCIHDGFGLVHFKEKLTGPEYAERFIREFEDLGIEARTSDFVTKVNRLGRGFELKLVSDSGIDTVEAGAIVLATGCRERTPRQVGIHGTRPSGIFTAGSAQNYINLMGQKIANKVVILGSGDIGLIMARRLTLEGAEVIGVYEIMPVPSGLARNIHQCLEDFNIPLHLSTTVTTVYGDRRVTGVDVAKVDENMRPIPGTEEHIECDTLITSVGLIPENELAESIGVEINSKTKGPSCDKNYQTSVPGIFSCGNSFHVYDLVDYVTESGIDAGKAASQYVKGALGEAEPFDVVIPPKKAVTPGKLVCIGCPNSCELDISKVDDGSGCEASGGKIRVEGNRCPKGIDFAVNELTNPSRTLCSTVRCSLPGKTLIPVRTSDEIPKSRIFDVMQEINKIVVDHQTEVGEVLVKNVLDTGVNLIVSGR